MSWDRKSNSGRSYYYRNKRVDGRSVKVYVGSGPKGRKAAQLDEEERLQRRRDQQYWSTVLMQIEQAGAPLEQLVQMTTLLWKAVLVTSGYHLHKGHEWRRRTHD